MLYKTHFIGGVIAGAAAGSNPAGIIIAGVASLLPDIDTPASVMGRKIWPFSALLKLTAGHRGFFHSLLSSALLYFLTMPIIPEYSLYILAGCLSHLILDSLNPQGVPLLWPLQFRFRIPLINTGSVVEKFLVVPLFLVAAYLVCKGVVL